MKYYIVDAFTEEIFGGNTAGVVILEDGDYPSSDIMVKIAAELRFSETVFVKKTNDETYELRYFTPTDELDLCGHATIAAFKIIGESGKSYKAVTKAGEINIDVKSNIILMEITTPEIIEEIESDMKWEATRGILGITPADELKTGGIEEISPAKVSVGVMDILMPVDSTDELDSITPDTEALKRLSERQNIVGIHAYAITKDGDSYKIDCRNFSPLYGIPEEAATGTANGALTYYLYQKGIIKHGVTNTFIQGTAMGKPSKIITLAEKDKKGNVTIKVGGSAAVFSRGKITL